MSHNEVEIPLLKNVLILMFTIDIGLLTLSCSRINKNLVAVSPKLWQDFIVMPCHMYAMSLKHEILQKASVSSLGLFLPPLEMTSSSCTHC